MSDTAPDVDIFDDWWWKSFEGRMARAQGGFIAMRNLLELSRRLSQQVDDEWQRRLLAEPVAHREQRLARQDRLRELVIGANEAADATEAGTLWAAVDAILADG